MTRSENQPSKHRPFSNAELAGLLGASLGPALRLLLHPTTVRQWPRLLSEGADPFVHLLLQANNTSLINKWLRQGTNVVFLSSYPRSGNTWMRFMLTDVFLQMHGVETTTQLQVHPDDFIPEFRGNSIVRRLARCPSWAATPPTAVIKTHSLVDRLEQIISEKSRLDPGDRSGHSKPVRGCKILYLYRSAEDALVSFYHFCLREPVWKHRAAGGGDAFCRTEVSRWMENVESYLRAPESGFPVFFVSYERILEQPTIVLSDVLQWLGLPHDAQMVQRAVSNMRFDKLQTMEAEENKTRLSAAETQLFFRRGYPGSGRSELQDATLRDIQDRTAPLFDEANRRMNQRTEQSAPATPILNHSDVRADQRNGHAGLNGHSNRNGGAKESKMLSRLQGM